MYYSLIHPNGKDGWGHDNLTDSPTHTLKLSAFNVWWLHTKIISNTHAIDLL